jgi:hypothetical protein
MHHQVRHMQERQDEGGHALHRDAPRNMIFAKAKYVEKGRPNDLGVTMR